MIIIDARPRHIARFAPGRSRKLSFDTSEPYRYFRTDRGPVFATGSQRRLEIGGKADPCDGSNCAGQSHWFGSLHVRARQKPDRELAHAMILPKRVKQTRRSQSDESAYRFERGLWVHRIYKPYSSVWTRERAIATQPVLHNFGLKASQPAQPQTGSCEAAVARPSFSQNTHKLVSYINLIIRNDDG
jgi:hypothetical protein